MLCGSIIAENRNSQLKHTEVNDLVQRLCTSIIMARLASCMVETLDKSIGKFRRWVCVTCSPIKHFPQAKTTWLTSKYSILPVMGIGTATRSSQSKNMWRTNSAVAHCGMIATCISNTLSLSSSSKSSIALKPFKVTSTFTDVTSLPSTHSTMHHCSEDDIAALHRNRFSLKTLTSVDPNYSLYRLHMNDNT